MKSKIKTMRSGPEVSDEEIQKYMNFDKLLLEKDKFIKRQRNLRLLRNSAITLGTLAIVAVIFFLVSETAETEVGVKETQSPGKPEKVQQEQSVDPGFTGE